MACGDGLVTCHHRSGIAVSSIPVGERVTLNLERKLIELSRCRGIGDRCKVGRSAGMITARRDAVRTQGRAPKAGGDQRDHEAVGSSSRLEAHAEVVKCDISAAANTLKSQDTPNLLSPLINVRAVTLKLYSRAPSSRVELRPSCKSPSMLASTGRFLPRTL